MADEMPVTPVYFGISWHLLSTSCFPDSVLLPAERELGMGSEIGTAVRGCSPSSGRLSFIPSLQC